ncbi:ATP-binding protein [candidate division KSB1 bacterium]|nr:ATP-binding protein [candidate division KSB1 bacterium]
MASHEVSDHEKKHRRSRAEPAPRSPLPQPYSNAHAHLLEELRWLNRLLLAHVLRLRHVNFYDSVKDLRGFFAADEEIDAIFAEEILENDKASGGHDTEQIAQLQAQAQQIRASITARLHATIAQNVVLPLPHLAGCFQLKPFEQQALLICLAPQLDARYDKIYAYLQNDLTKKFPSLDLILSLLCDNAEVRLSGLNYFHPAAPLRRFDLLETAENDWGSSAAHRALRINTRILHYALGNNAVDEQLAHDVRFWRPLAWDRVVLPDSFQQRTHKLFQMSMSEAVQPRPVWYFYGRAGVGKKILARALCSEKNVLLLSVDLRAWLAHPETLHERARLLLREGLLQPAAVYFEHLEKLEAAAEENPLLWPRLMKEIIELGWMTFVGSENPMPPALLDLPQIFPVEIPAPDHATQQALWKLHLDGALAAEETDMVEPLSARFNLTGGQIARAVHAAQQAGRVHEPERGQVSFAELIASSRIQSQPKLSTLARKVTPKRSWEELVLPEEQMRQLRELANQVKHSRLVMEEWGFGDKLTLGRGLNALFVGPSGTGKTMAAEVIARDLGLDLYKIDLSAVVSKYIGETEKNLNRVFTEAEHSNAILFFDEADALLGKRSEVKDAHDRYANIEIAYLLQKMEEYEGITILATNLRKNIDEAFTRRIRFIVEFPFPEESYRRRIWQTVWPRATPLATEVDLDFMARQFKLTGGNIRNVALAAAFFAADNGKAVGMKHLIRATKREYQKMSKLCMKSEFGQYYELLEREQ